MVSPTLYVVATTAVLYTAYSIASGLRANVQKARSIGLPYFVVPCLPFNMLWQATCHIWVPLIKLLPARLWQDWLFILQPDWGYRFQQEPFERLGDSFVVASPGGIVLFTQDPGAIHEIATRREHFPKATKFYQVLELFGRNLLSTEGAVWRLHRKVTSTSFNERNAAYTFGEAVHQTQSLLAKWGSEDGTIMTIEGDTMKLALHIIGYVGFGLRFVWPGERLPAEADLRLNKYGSLEPPAGHSMTFAVSVERVLHRIILLLMLPGWLLRALPFLATHEAYEAGDNYRRYMREFLTEKAAAVRAGDRGEGGMDIMGQLVRTQQEDRSGEGRLTDEEIIGNAFVMLVAGHETTANTLHFTLLELAANPAAQRALQADIDRLLGRDSDPATWDYEANIGAMQTSVLGAAMNETLRLMPPVVNIPKWVPPAMGGHQMLTLAGEPRALPAGMTVILSVITVQRHPRYWPAAGADEKPDVDDFVPGRWFRDGGEDEDQDIEEHEGSFVPFSDGARSCLGRRIAQVEILAALAVLFQRHSLELAVDDWADDAAVAAMDPSARCALYARAQARERETLRGARTLLTLKLHGAAAVPVRLVPRGEERFVHLVDL
ncbi:cytochrome p450 monooxygenase [Grosmannia clavigera kw1407]|uniref:Cytochrome p450 monooxygenase n=1 Tax=Grosmannia clavigera (strain kw1407 / UAMH 11150) TaxID=655863 RepID=F0XLP7_GROCL|nr:cytochrome p450 monooxygenase [Grosmannia clavigera kw1407]EFX01173.1 cytochrome p450 monooxygenase [Grosmannia clavigera kw1407]